MIAPFQGQMAWSGVHLPPAWSATRRRWRRWRRRGGWWARDGRWRTRWRAGEGRGKRGRRGGTWQVRTWYQECKVDRRDKAGSHQVNSTKFHLKAVFEQFWWSRFFNHLGIHVLQWGFWPKLKKMLCCRVLEKKALLRRRSRVQFLQFPLKPAQLTASCPKSLGQNRPDWKTDLVSLQRNCFFCEKKRRLRSMF